jgi:hypothetical protein
MGRPCLALAYVLTTLLAQAAHDHGNRPGNKGAHVKLGARQVRTDLAGQLTEARAHASATCLACQFRAEHQTSLDPAPSLLLTAIDLPPAPPITGASSRSILLATCRAPPRI